MHRWSSTLVWGGVEKSSAAYKEYRRLLTWFIAISCTDELMLLHSFSIRVYSHCAHSGNLNNAVHIAVILHRALTITLEANEDHFYITSVLHDLGLLKLRTNAHAEAWGLFSRSMSMKRRIFGETADHLSISHVYERKKDCWMKLNGSIARASKWKSLSMATMKWFQTLRWLFIA